MQIIKKPRYFLCQKSRRKILCQIGIINLEISIAIGDRMRRSKIKDFYNITCVSEVAPVVRVAHWFTTQRVKVMILESQKRSLMSNFVGNHFRGH